MSGPITSQGTKFLVQDGALNASAAIAGATKAAPTVMTLGAVPPADIAVGKIVIVKGSGWRSVEGRPIQVEALTGMQVTLGDTDTTDEAAAFPAIGASMASADFHEACMATLTFTSPAGAVIDVTTLCDMARKTINGLPGIATWNATGFWDSGDAVQKTLRALYRSGQNVAFQCLFIDGSGLAFLGSVNTFDIRVGIDQAVAITVGGNISGQMSFIEPAGVGALAAPAFAPTPAPAPQPAQVAA